MLRECYFKFSIHHPFILLPQSLLYRNSGATTVNCTGSPVTPLSYPLLNAPASSYNFRSSSIGKILEAREGQNFVSTSRSHSRKNGSMVTRVDLLLLFIHISNDSCRHGWCDRQKQGKCHTTNDSDNSVGSPFI